MKIFYIVIITGLLSLFAASCSNDKQDDNKEQPQANTSSRNDELSSNSKYQFPNDNGVGPVKEISLRKDIDPKLVSQGAKIFNMKCMACHKLDIRDVGPSLRNVTKKYTPVYIMNYLLNTTDMQRKDPIMQKMVAEYKIIMPDQVLSRDDARSLLEYFRSVER